MDNKIKLRITRYQRLAMEHAKMIGELERVRDELRVERAVNRRLAPQLTLRLSELEQIKRERDAVLSDLEKICKGFSACWRCKHYTAADTPPAVCIECNNRGKERNWEWCGVAREAGFGCTGAGIGGKRHDG